MHWIEDGSVSLMDFALPGLKPFYEDQVLAKQLLPLMLEEWMHHYQGKSKHHLSPLTDSFARYMEGQGTPLSPEILREVDIFAAFRDWGFPVDELGTVDQYTERGLFNRWLNSQ